MKAGLWRTNPATPSQECFAFGHSRKRTGKVTQADVLIAMMRKARSENRALDLPEIMRAGIAQHGARFKEIREQGFEIENEMERTSEGVVISRYWLRFDPEMDGAQ